MKKLIPVYFLSLLAMTCAYGQDVHFSQYFVAPQILNPASFGVLNSYEAGLQYKGQWNSFTNGYTSAIAFANQTFKSKKKTNANAAYVSAGVSLLYDKAGTGQLSTYKAEIPVNVSKRVSDNSFLTAGISVGVGQLAVQNNNFTWGSQFDGYQYDASMSSHETSVAQTKTYFDCGAGLSFVTLKNDNELSAPRNQVGFSIGHLNQPGYSLYGVADQKLNMRFNFYDYYYLYMKNSNVSFIPSILVQYQGNAYEMIVGSYVRRKFAEEDNKKSKYLSLGVFYRLQDMFSLNCMVETGKYSLGVNYDFNVSKLTPTSHTFGGFELSLKARNPFQYTSKGNSTIYEKF